MIVPPWKSIAAKLSSKTTEDKVFGIMLCNKVLESSKDADIKKKISAFALEKVGTKFLSEMILTESVEAIPKAALTFSMLYLESSSNSAVMINDYLSTFFRVKTEDLRNEIASVVRSILVVQNDKIILRSLEKLLELTVQEKPTQPISIIQLLLEFSVLIKKAPVSISVQGSITLRSLFVQCLYGAAQQEIRDEALSSLSELLSYPFTISPEWTILKLEAKTEKSLSDSFPVLISSIVSGEIHFLVEGLSYLVTQRMNNDTETVGLDLIRMKKAFVVCLRIIDNVLVLLVGEEENDGVWGDLPFEVIIAIQNYIKTMSEELVELIKSTEPLFRSEYGKSNVDFAQDIRDVLSSAMHTLKEYALEDKDVFMRILDLLPIIFKCSILNGDFLVGKSELHMKNEFVWNKFMGTGNDDRSSARDVFYYSIIVLNFMIGEDNLYDINADLVNRVAENCLEKNVKFILNSIDLITSIYDFIQKRKGSCYEYLEKSDSVSFLSEVNILSEASNLIYLTVNLVLNMVLIKREELESLIPMYNDTAWENALGIKREDVEKILNYLKTIIQENKDYTLLIKQAGELPTEGKNNSIYDSEEVTKTYKILKKKELAKQEELKIIFEKLLMK